MNTRKNLSNVFIKELKVKAAKLEPTVRVGKNGMTESIIEEIKCQLKKRKLIKVKMLKSVIEEIPKDELMDEISDKTGATVIHKVGFVLVLYKS